MSAAVPPMPFRRLALAAGLLAAAACSPPLITSDRDPTIPIPAGATVAFHGATSEGSTQVTPGVSNDIMHSRIQQAIIAQLKAKGFTMVDSSQPSTFTVRYYVGMKQNTSYVTTTSGVSMGSPYYGGYGAYGYGYGWGGYGGYSSGVSTTSPVTTTNVSFVVDLGDVATGKTAWRGIYQGEASSSPPTDAQLKQKADAIFKTLPAVP